VDWLRSAAVETPEAPALIAGADVVPYADLDSAATAIAGAFSLSGVDVGSRVAVWGAPEPRTVAAIWGIWRAGAEPVILTPGLPAMHAARLVERAGVVVLWDRADDELGPPRPGGFVPECWGPPDAGSRLIVFTTGSRGDPKGVVITGAMVQASVEASRLRLGNGAEDRWLAALPLSHVAGMSILWRAARDGAPVVLERWFDAARAARLLAVGAVAYTSLVPTMLRRVLDAGPERYHPDVRGVLVGGGPVEESLMARALDAGLPALATYGLTETVGQVATVAPGEERASLGTVGRPLDGIDVRVVGPDRLPVPGGAAGRIEVRGPTVTPGYLGEPARDAGEWFRTGDVGMFGDSGALSVLGRADDVIVTGGENVHPAQVEAVVRSIPGVADVRVYGEDDEEWGRVVVADLVVDPDGLGEVQARARAGLPGFMVPKRWRVVDRIERNWKG